MVHNILSCYTSLALKNFLPKSGNSISISSLRHNSGMGKLSGKVAVVTASTEGIGFAIVKRLAIDGAKVVISSRKEANVSNAVKQLQNLGLKDVLGTVCHVGNPEDRSKLFSKTIEAFGKIDILVSNAAANPVIGNIEDCPESAWDKIFEINVKSPFLLTKEVLPYLRQNNGGKIIYISSIAAFRTLPMLGPYSVSKTALLQLTKVFAQELAASNITVNSVAPGIVRTNFSKPLHEPETIRDIILADIPMNRLGEPDEIAGAVSFLCSEDASFITGETIVISGGQQSRL